MAEGFFDFLKNFLVAPNWYPAVPILGFIIIAAASVGLSTSEYGEEGPASGSGAWPAPMALSLGLLGAWVALGNYSDGSAPLIVYTGSRRGGAYRRHLWGHARPRALVEHQLPRA